MIVYRFIHQNKIDYQSIDGIDYCHLNDISGTEYASPYRIYRLANGSITIELYSHVTIAYQLILEVLQNYLPNKSANITIVTTMGTISQIFIEPTNLQANYVGHQIPQGELYEEVNAIVRKYYPCYQYQQFLNGFLVRPYGFIKLKYWNQMLSELIAIYQHHYEIWVSFAANHGVVISLNRR